MTRPFSKDEPARQPGYRKLYLRYKRDFDILEDQILHLKAQIEDLCKRVRALEGDPE